MWHIEKSYSQNSGEIDTLLRAGWEPFSVTYNGTYYIIWFKKKVE